MEIAIPSAIGARISPISPRSTGEYCCKLHAMNIILKAFDGPSDHETIEHALKEISLGTCISILWDLREVPDLDAQEHILIDARTCKEGHYPNVDWTTITPLDEELIEGMRHCEAVFMKLNTWHSLNEIPYSQLRRQYFDHLRYWNHVLDTKEIDLLLLNHVPHQNYDLVLYDLCKLKGIQTLNVERCNCCGLALLVEDWEDPSKDTREVMQQLQKEYSDPKKSIVLSPLLENYYEGQTKRDEAPWYMYPRHKHLLQKNFVRKWSGKALTLLLQKPFQFFSYLFSPQFWKRKIAEHKTIRFYDKYVQTPDFSKPFIYVALHMQPEATTCPLGGAFVDQELLVQLLAAHLPNTVSIYIKEHPHQGEQMRSEAFYESMARLPQVVFMPRDTSTVQLAENAVATATVTGTAGFESLFREKPVFLFGHIFYQDIPGVHKIRNHTDCAKAMEAVFVRNEKPKLRDVRLFLKALDVCGSTFEDALLAPGDVCPIDKQVTILGNAIAKKIQTMQSNV